MPPPILAVFTKNRVNPAYDAARRAEARGGETPRPRVGGPARGVAQGAARGRGGGRVAKGAPAHRGVLVPQRRHGLGGFGSSARPRAASGGGGRQWSPRRDR